MDRSRLLLAGLLQLLAILYAVWFWGDRQYTLALLVFSLPPIVLMIGVAARRRHICIERRAVNVTVNVTTPDVAGFQRSHSQIAAQMSRALARGERNS